ncbi:hydroxyphenylacetyl-CoA thioesterase PaaI [Thalassococcus sp. CAU 1522]|uniref:Hydroxyphenylacetyl-CoA thioesterase PaaI n=1 Tax=Thalassococcus arenae TaxID=2851652 RepID=A0ABS6N3E7_9RHOB|nr:hydroxyphenylacetyl-CoA thioesterase PaaI [Thalassococcus arenae]MBV2358540.1 hydroxyphenylacetyl-CoA thioesterase PaaI [Thalassococcus arenae]
MTPQDRAKRAAQAMWDGDAASKWFGFEIAEVTEGRAVLTLTVQSHHCNGHGMCHGGVTFALADSAFAFACNSRNQRTVAQANTIHYLSPAHTGDTLTATAREVRLTGRTGLYDVTVTRGDGTVIAEFRGQSRAISGHLFEEDAP